MEESIRKIFNSIQLKEKINDKTLIKIKNINRFCFCFALDHYHTSGLLLKKGK
jgi:hypothetical protein